MEGKLVLADGSVFSGELASGVCSVGEVVFNTGMTGYQEMLTDPSYCGQILTMTYPLIGNYGVFASNNQSRQPYVKGLVIGELCNKPGGWQQQETLSQYLAMHNITCLTGVDTRAVTRRIRTNGTMRGVIATAEEADSDLAALWGSAETEDLVSMVTTPRIVKIANKGPHVVVIDFGIKRNIVNMLLAAGCSLTIVPAQTSAAEVLALKPDGIFLSNGPGDPKCLPGAIETVKALVGRKPIFGICLGHQILALAFGCDTCKMSFGHRGGNHPVRDSLTGKVAITSQNHGYVVAEESLSGKNLIVTHRAVNDGTVEGLRHAWLPIFSVQYHPEAGPGPDDSSMLFAKFIRLITEGEENFAKKTKFA
jgi:carbamoyl-phosphate synthase small subunit